MKYNPIVIVEDDADDRELLISTFQEIGVSNEFRCFENPVPALHYLKHTHELPFVIISDLNMPKMTGLLFKKAINEDASLSRRKIPFVLMSTNKGKEFVDLAFNCSVQGFFQKPSDMESLKEIATAIVLYWKNSNFHLQTIR